MTLESGDLILKGIPEGVLFCHPKITRYIQPEDVVTVETRKAYE
ncbi:hypothetical protein J7E71_18225 [Mesobacillus foraminis]|nr:hypothetical protein [Mesobacillus foraminis]